MKAIPIIAAKPETYGVLRSFKMAHGDKVSRRMEQAIAALLSNPTVQGAAAAVGVNVRTLCEWLKQPAFKRAYAQAREEVLERTVARLLSITSKAVETLERNLNCDEPGPEIRAAVAILNQALKSSEVLDLARRVQELEERLLPKGNRHESGAETYPFGATN